MLTSNTSIHSSEKYTKVRGLTQLDKLLTDRPTNAQMAKRANINLGFKKKSFGMLLSECFSIKVGILQFQ